MTEILTQLAAWLGAISALFVGIIAVATFIPGEEPEKSLKKFVAWIEAISAKLPKKKEPTKPQA